MAGEKKEIPEWQRQSTPSVDDAHNGEETKVQESEKAPPTSRENLVEQARKFLAHEEIQDATVESKISFLEEKGLTNEEIHGLLGVSRNDTQPSEGEQPSDQTEKAMTSSEPAPPPIITYPEFLLHASKPPPIVTPARALKAVYGATLIGGALYGVSKFVLQPMFDTLSESRHELFSVTKEQLEPLNKKLEGVVSTLPASNRESNVGHERRKEGEDGEDSDDDSSVVSDPTEMFHRDMGVQTSPPTSPSLLAVDDDGERSTATGLAASRLSSLRDNLSSLLESSRSTEASSDDAKKAMKETEAYLDQLKFGEGGGGYGIDDGWRSQIFGGKVAGLGTKKGDSVEDLKAEIRSLKGAMLSARNFPRGVK